MTPTEKHRETGLMLWIECLRDGTPDAGNIIAAALAQAEREGMKHAATFAAIHSQYPIESDYDKGYSQGAKDASERIRREANTTSPDAIPVGAKAGEAGSPPSSTASPAPHSPWRSHGFNPDRAENCKDKIDHGTNQIGETNSCAKLTADQVREIRSLEGTVSQREIAGRHRISQGTVWAILKRKKWSHI